MGKRGLLICVFALVCLICPSLEGDVHSEHVVECMYFIALMIVVLDVDCRSLLVVSLRGRWSCFGVAFNCMVEDFL